MSNEYRIEPAGNAFIVIDPWGERLVDVFPTEDAAQKDIERCQREDAMYETATQLVDIAIEGGEFKSSRRSGLWKKIGHRSSSRLLA